MQPSDILHALVTNTPYDPYGSRERLSSHFPPPSPYTSLTSTGFSSSHGVTMRTHGALTLAAMGRARASEVLNRSLYQGASASTLRTYPSTPSRAPPTSLKVEGSAEAASGSHSVVFDEEKMGATGADGVVGGITSGGVALGTLAEKLRAAEERAASLQREVWVAEARATEAREASTGVTVAHMQAAGSEAAALRAELARERVARECAEAAMGSVRGSCAALEAELSGVRTRERELVKELSEVRGGAAGAMEDKVTLQLALAREVEARRTAEGVALAAKAEAAAACGDAGRLAARAVEAEAAGEALAAAAANTAARVDAGVREAARLRIEGMAREADASGARGEAAVARETLEIMRMEWEGRYLEAVRVGEARVARAVSEASAALSEERDRGAREVEAVEARWRGAAARLEAEVARCVGRGDEERRNHARELARVENEARIAAVAMEAARKEASSAAERVGRESSARASAEASLAECRLCLEAANEKYSAALEAEREGKSKEIRAELGRVENRWKHTLERCETEKLALQSRCETLVKELECTMDEVREAREVGRRSVEEAVAGRVRAEEGRRREVECAVASERACRNAEAERAAGAAAALISALQKELRDSANRGECSVRAEESRAARAEARLQEAEVAVNEAREEGTRARSDLARTCVELESVRRASVMEKETWRVRLSEVEGGVTRERERREICEREVRTLASSLTAANQAFSLLEVELRGVKEALEDSKREGQREKRRFDAEAEAGRAATARLQAEVEAGENERTALSQALSAAQVGVGEAIAGLEASGRALEEERSARRALLGDVESLKAKLGAAQEECALEASRAKRIEEIYSRRVAETGEALSLAASGEAAATASANEALARVRELEASLTAAQTTAVTSSNSLEEAIAARASAERERGSAIVKLGEAEERAREAISRAEAAREEAESERRARCELEQGLGEREGEVVALKRQLEASQESERGSLQTLSTLSQELAVSKTSLDNAKGRIEALGAELSSERTARASIFRDLGNATARASAAEGRAEELTCALAVSKGAEAKAVASSSSSSREAESAKRDSLLSQKEATRLEEELKFVKAELERSLISAQSARLTQQEQAAAMDVLKRELNEASNHVAALEGDLGSLKEKILAQEKSIASAQEARRVAMEGMEAARAQAAVAENEAAAARAAAAAGEARALSIEASSSDAALQAREAVSAAEAQLDAMEAACSERCARLEREWGERLANVREEGNTRVRRAENASVGAVGRAAVLESSVGVWRGVLRDVGAGLQSLGRGLGEAMEKASSGAHGTPLILQLQGLDGMVRSLSTRVEGAAQPPGA